MRRQPGFTMIEMMICCTLLVLFGGLCTSFLHQVWRTGTTTEGYVTDLGHCRAALQMVEADLRRSHRTEQTDGSVRLHVGTTKVDYSLASGVLTRSVGSKTRVIARRIAAFDVTPRGRLVDVRLTLLTRSRNAPPAEIFTTVCQLGGQSR